VETEELEALNPLNYSHIDVDAGVLAASFPVVHDQLLCLADFEGEIVIYLVIKGSCNHSHDSTSQWQISKLSSTGLG
jgi:hypothetical protein